MIEKKQMYLCKVCGNVVESLWNGKPDLSCCGQEMVKLDANTVDAAREKHVPVIQRDGDRVKVQVGSAPHPMEAKHYILCIEVLSGKDVYRHDLEESDTVAEAVFCIPAAAPVIARAYCNLHGLWASS